jgi:arginine/ornithine transport system permease protein
MLLVFFGGQMVVNRLAPALGYENYIDISPFIAGVLTIGFIYGAYMTETFRGAILAVPAAQLEAGRAFGMRGGQVFTRILLPQMMRHALPGLGNNWLVLLKTTALLSIIGLDDMVRKASLAGGATREPFTFLFAVALIYLALTTISEIIQVWAERRAGRPYAGRPG